MDGQQPPGRRAEARVVLITGAAGGLGRALAEVFARQELRLVLTDLRLDDLERQASALRARGVGVTCHRHDVADERGWSEVVAAIAEEHGRLDVLVNNAAISGRGGPDRLSVDDWDAIMATNARSVFLGARAAARLMERGGGGAIVNVASGQAAMLAAYDPAYGASKAAVRSVSMSLAAHYARRGIRVNTVHPGWMRTDMFDTEDGFPQEVVDRIPAGRLGDPLEIAEAVSFLADPRSGYVVGADLVVDGGANTVPLGWDFAARHLGASGVHHEDGGTNGTDTA